MYCRCIFMLKDVFLQKFSNSLHSDICLVRVYVPRLENHARISQTNRKLKNIRYVTEYVPDNSSCTPSVPTLSNWWKAKITDGESVHGEDTRTFLLLPISATHVNTELVMMDSTGSSQGVRWAPRQPEQSWTDQFPKSFPRGWNQEQCRAEGYVEKAQSSSWADRAIPRQQWSWWWGCGLAQVTVC